MSHITPTANRWRRKVAGLPVIVWLLIVLAGTAAAVVGLIVTLGTSGTITAAEERLDVKYVVGSPIVATAVPGVAGSAFTCTAQIVSETELRITMNEVANGDRCDIGNFAVRNEGPATAKLQGFNLLSPGFAGGEISATVNTCGKEIPAGAQSDIGFKIHVGAVGSGQTFSFNPAQDGLEWVTPLHYVAADCNT